MNKSQHPALVIACLLVILAVGAIAHIQLWDRDTKGEDVYYNWVEGSRLLNGEDPYARILAGNMHENDKYATYFPGFYGLSALTQAAGLRDYDTWIAFWRVIFLAFDLAIAAALYLLLYPRGRLLAACFAAAFWLFGRWTLHVTEIAHIDFIPIFLMVASLGLFRKHRWTALLLFSLSLGVKQIAIFLVPLYLIWTWQSVRQDKLKQTLLAGLVIASVPILTSLPFLAWHADGFIESLAFSATRNPVDHFSTPSLDGQMGWLGLPARLPMLVMLLAVYGLAWRRKIGIFVASLFAMSTFVDFNSVLFRQYLAWLVPLIPLVMLDLWDNADRSADPEALPPGPVRS
ncbi:MAG: hypothetical protein MUC51_06520 [Anaerolineae bacterium]|jgi:hypothetical protein|nr:hypothetical protein [Anaerolineae bacterium]